MRVGTGGPVPNLFRQHAPVVRHVQHGVEVWAGVLAGGQRILATLARQQDPESADAGAVPAMPVRLLAIAVVIVAIPVRTVRSIDADNLIDDGDGFLND